MKRLISLQHQNLQNITKFRFSSHELYEKYQEFLQKKHIPPIFGDTM